ncbi:RAVE protein 1 C terminal-domain-containing protein [Crucibulum laeve]|uniref:RAVE protein 1 C terminal-domain-containing protein n=1 Tax=Crucibulum laeve TaxID=68775 RepID=A0A5C3LUL5_9AGAR|nr:RAVE protein 1 C terminal-domain-containing protein [Crucibulum laeve]
MLQPQQSYVGYPAAGLQQLLLPPDALLLYPSADSVIILNARTLALTRVLAFWEAFPRTFHTQDAITSLSVDSGMKLIVAAMNTRIVAWSLSGVQQDAWRIHSTLVLADNQTITTLDNKAGLLAVGTEKGLSIYTLILENDLPTWSKKWTVSAISPILVNFAPSLMYIATVSKKDNAVRLYSTTSGRQTQIIPHPRPITKLSWRHSQASSRDDLIMYTITSDSALRIFLPVLDAPEHLQLHACLDLFSSLPFSVAESHLGSSPSHVFWLDREIVGNALNHILQDHPQEDDARTRRISEIKEEGWDLFLRILGDGSVVVTAVANLDRRPPTLLKQFTLQHSAASTFPHPPSYLYLLPNPDPGLITLATTPPLAAFDLSPLSFFDAQSNGLRPTAKGLDRVPEEDSDIIRFVRTPEGKGVGVLRSNRGGGAWRIVERGTKLVRAGNWSNADFVVVLEKGRQVATYSKSDGLLTLHTSPLQTVTLPLLESLFTLPSSSGSELIVGVTPDFSIVQLRAETSKLTLCSENHLPLTSPPQFILPVDPMAWGMSHAEHDALLSVSEAGVLAFWVPENSDAGWRCTGKVRTGRSGFKKARCSSVKKTALIVPGSDGDELTIWDSTESEFASGLEYRGVYQESILDLDWSSTPDMQSILAVGFLRHVDILCQQRSTYFDEGPGWTLCRKIEIQSFTPYPISDSIWLAHGSFLVGAGHQMYLFGDSPQAKGDSSETLFEYVARQNGPLDDYHPQMLLQCLLWDKIELVKDIIVNLAHDVEHMEEDGKVQWTSVPVERFFGNEKTANMNTAQKKRYTMLFNEPTPKEESEEEGFSRSLVARLIKTLEANPLPHLTPNEQAHLIVLIQTTLEISEQQRSLDSNGLRYLISMRSFYIINHRAVSNENSPSSNGAIPRETGRRERLRYRDMIWAFHSESQELLLSASTAACNGKMVWTDARALGIALWLNSLESLKTQLELIARNEYMAGDDRDPTACSLFYFALGKSKLVHGLWRQAAWHKEQAVMLKFLANDFSEPRWRTAALKNAYALLSKRRFEYAAAFFLLGNSLKDAVNVCIKQLGDFQLAVALARVVEQGNDGPILQSIFTDTVLPTAFQLGNRWLGSWAFWLLHRRDLAVRILLTPLQDIAAAFDVRVTEIGEPHYDDPSLALLFSQLRSKTLQAAKGTSEISGRAEFNFVLQMSRVFCRMGCHALALDLVRSWSFERPSTAVHGPPASPQVDQRGPPSPTVSRRPIFPLEPALRRRTSIVIDMDIVSLPPTRSASPERGVDHKEYPIDTIKEENDLLARKAGLGNLMKSAKQDVQIPEFDMNAFF